MCECISVYRVEINGKLKNICIMPVHSKFNWDTYLYSYKNRFYRHSKTYGSLVRLYTVKSNYTVRNTRLLKIYGHWNRSRHWNTYSYWDKYGHFKVYGCHGIIRSLKYYRFIRYIRFKYGHLSVYACLLLKVHIIRFIG